VVRLNDLAWDTAFVVMRTYHSYHDKTICNIPYIRSQQRGIIHHLYIEILFRCKHQLRQWDGCTSI
jgi:hypothetical protein